MKNLNRIRFLTFEHKYLFPKCHFVLSVLQEKILEIKKNIAFFSPYLITRIYDDTEKTSMYNGCFHALDST